MFLKRIDETIQSGNFDLTKEDSKLAYLIEQSWEDNSLQWKIIDEDIRVSSEILFYDDTPDGSNTYFGSWQKFYAEGTDFTGNAPYSGSVSIFSGGSPNFGGISKVAVYLRHSQGFINWIASFDPEAARAIEHDLPLFEKLFEMEGAREKTKKLSSKWHNSKLPKSLLASNKAWGLPSLCTLSDKSRIVLFLKNHPSGDYSELEDSDINIARSLELMSLLRETPHSSNEIISGEFQMASGMGRNAFGNSYSTNDISSSEYGRLLGETGESSREQILSLLDQKLEYRIKVSPNPDSSCLFFLPEGSLKYSELQQFINKQNTDRSLFFEKLKEKKSKTDDSEKLIAHRSDLIPTLGAATIFLVNKEGSQKKKWVIQQVFPSISLNYLQILNTYLLHHNIQGKIVHYMKRCLTSQDTDTACVYHYWTYVFTAAIQKRQISTSTLFFQFQRFCKSYRGDELLEKRYPLDYLKLCYALGGLNKLIREAKNNPAILQSPDFHEEIFQQITLDPINTKLFDTMEKTSPSIASLVGEAHYSCLSEEMRYQFNHFIQLATPTIPDKEFTIIPDKEFRTFAKGLLTGFLLNRLSWRIEHDKEKKLERKFPATQGRHPSRLRGKEITKIFEKGLGLLKNLNAERKFNNKMLPFIKSVETESRKDSFNSGLIMGLVYFTKKTTEQNTETND